MDTGTDYRRYIPIAGLIVALWGLWSIVSAIITVNVTGLLTVTASRPTAVISVSQSGKNAEVIGIGDSRVRLSPGTYQLVATYKGSSTASIVRIEKKRPSKAYLDLAKTSVLPSPASINFQNMYFLLAQGITQSQAGQLQTEFFQFKPQAHTVAVDASSVQAGAPNPGPSASFSLKFDVAVDGVTYKAVASYSDFDTIRLRLISPDNGKLIFDSNNSTEKDYTPPT